MHNGEKELERHACLAITACPKGGPSLLWCLSRSDRLTLQVLRCLRRRGNKLVWPKINRAAIFLLSLKQRCRPEEGPTAGPRCAYTQLSYWVGVYGPGLTEEACDIGVA